MSETTYEDRITVTGSEEKDVNSIDRYENVFETGGHAFEYFQAKKFRPNQRETVDEIENAYEQGYKVVMLDAPTGSGKSHIANAFARQSKNAHIITVQKILQSQYERDFSHMAIMKGRSSYRCLSESVESCADGPCTLSKEYDRHSGCPYSLAILKAINSEIIVHNFYSFYYQNIFGQRFTGRNLLIIDECHAIENAYVEFMSFRLSSRDKIIGNIPEFKDDKKYTDWLISIKKDFEHEYSILFELYERSVISREDLQNMQRIGKLLVQIGSFLIENGSSEGTEYIVEFEDKDLYQNLIFRPVMVNRFIQNSLFKYGKRILLMSATILDKEMFCKSLGLNPDEVYYLQVPSIFPVENRPIIKKYAGSMSYKDIDKTLPKMILTIKEIMDKFISKKGIIQTHSERIAEYIKLNLIDSRLTFNKDFDTPEVMIEVHKKKDNSFIVASGLREGIDLYGDLSRIQVLCKVPYPSLKDKRIKRRMELDSDWYGYVTALMFVQILGRSIRSENDKAITYILDSGFGYFYTRNKRFIPSYIKEAIRW